MKNLEITYTREVTLSKIVKVSDKLAERLLKLDSKGSLIEKPGKWAGIDNIDDEIVDEDVYKETDVSSDDFTLITEDLSDLHDICDSLNEIENIQVKIMPKAKKR